MDAVKPGDHSAQPPRRGSACPPRWPATWRPSNALNEALATPFGAQAEFTDYAGLPPVPETAYQNLLWHVNARPRERHNPIRRTKERLFSMAFYRPHFCPSARRPHVRPFKSVRRFSSKSAGLRKQTAVGRGQGGKTISPGSAQGPLDSRPRSLRRKLATRRGVPCSLAGLHRPAIAANFISRDLDLWDYVNKVTLDFSRPWQTD